MSHPCHALGCEVEVPPKMLMCLKHWNMVPAALKNRVWAEYRRGQEIDKRPSARYLAAAGAAIQAVREVENHAAE